MIEERAAKELDRQSRLGLGFMAACVSTVAFYAGLRLVQAKLFPEPNPATIVWSAHAGYFWRCLTVSYAGVMCGFLAYAGARRHAELVMRGLATAMTVAVTILVFQSLFVP
jgi:hypothetical protein